VVHAKSDISNFETIESKEIMFSEVDDVDVLLCDFLPKSELAFIVAPLQKKLSSIFSDERCRLELSNTLFNVVEDQIIFE